MNNMEIINEMKERKIKSFKEIGFATILYTFIMVFCLYKNLYGITSIFYSIATVGYMLYIAKTYHKKYKPINIFISLTIILLGISNFITADYSIIFFNYVGIIGLIIMNMIYLYVDVSRVSIFRYVTLFCTIIVGVLVKFFDPVDDLVTYIKNKKIKRNKTIFNIIIGVFVSIPICIVLICILTAADAVFNDFVLSICEDFDLVFIFSNLLGTGTMFVAGIIITYAFVKYIVSNDISIKKGKILNASPAIPVVATSMIAFVYVIFSLIQIFYLFLGKGNLPEGYTYASYAREGFFQLLVVCAFNIVLILLCTELFKEHNIFKLVLLVISICTYIMLASSVFRMYLYISEYGLTTFRVVVLWSLLVMAIVMIIFTLRIFNANIDVIKSCVVIIASCYLVLALGKVDYHVAKYNFEMYKEMNTVDDFYTSYVDYDYIYSLSIDAAPVILEHQHEIEEFEEQVHTKHKKPKWFKEKYRNYIDHYNFVTIRKINLSLNKARLSLEKYNNEK